MKQCSACEAMKPHDEFHKRSRSRDGLQHICKSCNKEQRKAYYKTAHGRDRNITTGRRYRHALAQRVIDYLKDHPCVDCGETDPVVLDFDHRGEKIANVGNMVRNSFAWYKVQAEIAKCDVRCANCHRRKTARQFSWYKLLVTSTPS